MALMIKKRQLDGIKENKEAESKQKQTERLVYGKAQIAKVVGIEVHDNASVEIFVQGDNGSVSSVFRNTRFWILSNTNIDGRFHHLAGNLHYAWGKQYSYLNDYNRQRAMWRNTDIYSIYNVQEATMVKDGYCYYQGLKIKDVSVMSFDIETTGLDPLDANAKILMISTSYRDYTGNVVNKLFPYDKFKDEGDMIATFGKYIKEKNPSIITGHNILVFDIPYIIARAKKANVAIHWGRDDSKLFINKYESKFRLDGTRDLLYRKVKIYGREIVDTFFLAVAFDVSKTFETYALKSIVKQLGFEKKDRQHYDASLIRKNYTDPQEWEKIKKYAEDDAEDPLRLWDHMGPLYFNMAPMIPKSFTDMILSASGSKINGLMVRAYLQEGHSIPKATPVENFKGAISFAVPGIYSNCFKIDLASLYPSIMIEYSVYDKTKDPKAYLLELVKIFREKRLHYKKLANDTKDSYWKEMDVTAKGILNSFYGFCGAPGLNFNSIECAAFITNKGREILEYTIQWASGKDLKEFINVEEKEETSETEGSDSEA